ncbi:MAG: hypothetical protein CVV31_10380 [Methanomicrobiales archaeon HGW-Methanomicrobiales-2]|jgi:hypothetical protein|nr:MAG: hypothetical protein CVV31_10380 [Methanomicrobiales archaeon HGW-Methanomicrobiales-2]
MKRRPAAQIPAILTLLITVSLLAVPAFADDSNPSTIPHFFYGQVYNADGSDAPAGSIIVASVAGNPAGTITVAPAGRYGIDYGDGDKLLVWTPAMQPGDTIVFHIAGVLAVESAVYESGGLTNLTLTASVTPTPSPTGGGGGGGGGGSHGFFPTSTSTPPVPTMPVGQASLSLSETGEVSESVTVRTGDGVGSLTVGAGTRARDANGNALGEVTIERVDAAGLPPIPPGATIGFALDCGPAGATFDPPVTLTYTLSEEEWEEIGDLATLSVMWYNPGTGEWQEVPATVDPATRTVTAQISHFSLFALTWAAAPPGEATAGPTGTTPGAGVTEGEPGARAAGDLPMAMIAMVAGTIVIIAAGFLLFRRR